MSRSISVWPIWAVLLVTSFALLSAEYALTDAEISLIQTTYTNITLTINANDETITLSHTGVPDHGYTLGSWGNNPNTPSAQNYDFTIPRNATVASTKGCVQLGSIGLSLSGATFYNPYTAFGYNAVAGDCDEDFDDCSGHPSSNGAYHYHKLPACLYTGADLRDILLGVAFDGYPIYGPMDGNGNTLTSSDLDTCHGYTYNGRYIYRITTDFPYIMSCYHGQEIQSGGGSGPPPPGRRKRSVDYKAHANRLRRQTMSVSDCNSAEYENWESETCYAFCENPSTGTFDDGDCQTSLACQPYLTHVLCVLLMLIPACLSASVLR